MVARVFNVNGANSHYWEFKQPVVSSVVPRCSSQPINQEQDITGDNKTFEWCTANGMISELEVSQLVTRRVAQPQSQQQSQLSIPDTQ